jgi:hypothetical protein
MPPTLLVYDHQGRPEFSALALAFARGAERRGATVQFRNPSVYQSRGGYEPAAAVLVHGINGPCGTIVRDHLAAGGCPIVLEMGYVRRGDGLDAYWSLGIGGLNAHADFRNGRMPGDRWEALGVPLARWRDPGTGTIVLVAGQVPGDANVAGLDTRRWAEATISELRGHTDRPIVYRPHPKDFNPGGVDGVPLSRRPLHEDLAQAWALVTWNSNSAVEAVLAGVPVFCLSRAMASPVGLDDLSRIETPATPDRQQWAHDLAYTQWRLDEMEAGLPWRHLMEGWPDAVDVPATEPAAEMPPVDTPEAPPKKRPIRRART